MRRGLGLAATVCCASEQENDLATFVGSTSVTAPAARPLRRALLASAAFAVMAGASTGVAEGAAAQGYYFNPSSSIFNPYRSYDPSYRSYDPYVEPSKPRSRPVHKPQSETDLPPSSKSKSNQKSEAARDAAALTKGPLQLVVSIANQHVTLYSNGTRVAQSPVSTGVPDRPTPTGVFSIIQKDRFHHSNLYSNAPMPYMERITWSGVALHEGPLPGYPASHGCIRLTHDFAVRLWGTARLGVRVIVARTDVVPVDFAHPRLFDPKAKPAEPPTASNEPEKPIAASPLDADTAASPTGDLGGTVEPPRSGVVETTARVAGPASAPSAVAAPDSVSATDPPKPAPDVAEPAKMPPVPASPKARGADQPPKHTGTIAVFISRREKKLFVRQGFVPLFDVPVEIERPEQPFGTHVFTALGLTDNGTRMRWNLMTMPSEPRPVITSKTGGRIETRPAEPYAPQTAGQVLDRIRIPQETVDRIDEILTPGASLVVSDQGLGSETGEGTDFIVLAR
jgi:lipoprotein-anchoring transpeptidase ErfK/SrfK